MESSNSTSAPRRTEDIALDLLKFIASHANLGAKGGSATGFGLPSTPKPEDQVTQLFELYTRCRIAVESPLPGTAAQK
ncbi:MAG: hypothetical protein WBY53_04160 [Acidobacteriaceae bacterium]